MEKIIDCRNNTIKKIETRTKANQKNSAFYGIQLIRRENRNDVRMSLPIFKEGKNPRITASSNKSGEDAIIKLLDKIKIKLIEGIEEKYIAVDNMLHIFGNISNSLKELNLQTDMLLIYLHNTISEVYKYLNLNEVETTNSQIDNCGLVDSKKNKTLPVSNTKNQLQVEQTVAETLPVNLQATNCFTETNDKDLDIPNSKNQMQNGQGIVEILPFKDVAIKWFGYKLLMV